LSSHRDDGQSKRKTVSGNKWCTSREVTFSSLKNWCNPILTFF
jgi:hypothetical protein